MGTALVLLVLYIRPKYRIINNILVNRLMKINNRIDYNWLKSYKINCKKMKWKVFNRSNEE